MIRIILLLAIILFSGCAPTRTWLALGDSITYLNDHQDETGDRISKGYMTLVTEELPDIRYVNKGFNGWTATDVAGKIDQLDLTPADVYTVFLGTNDWWRGTPLGSITDYRNNTGNSTFFGSLRIIIDRLRSLNEDARIILMTPMQRVDFVYIADMKNNAYGSYRDKNGQWLRQFADAITQVAREEKLELVDLYNDTSMGHEDLVRFKRLRDPATGEYRNFPYPDFIDVPFNPEADEYPYPPEAMQMTYDGLHPSDAGHKQIAARLTPLVRR